jgi:hypothetical protein
MNNFKFFQKNPIYKSGDVVAVICDKYDHYFNFINETRRSLNDRRRRRVMRFDTIDDVRYICVNRSDRFRGYRINHIITLENANQNPFYDEINHYIQLCLVNETI